MMSKKLDVTKFPPEVVSLLTAGEQPVIIEHDGKAVAVLVSPEEFQRWQERGKRFFSVLDLIGARNSGATEKEVEADVEHAISQVRARSQ